MDPATIVGLLEGSISLAVQCGSVAKRLNYITVQYKNAKLIVSTIVQNLDIMQLAWNRIAAWFRANESSEADDIIQRVERFLDTGFLVMGALEEDLQSYIASDLNLAQRSRLLWNENILQAHQSRIRDQAASMTLLLQVIQLPTEQDRSELLQQSETRFLKSDESAYSIVPSRLSSRFSASTSAVGNRNSIRSDADLIYRPLDFEDDLFTARVYKRNYRTRSHAQLSNPRPHEDDKIPVAPKSPQSEEHHLLHSKISKKLVTPEELCEEVFMHRWDLLALDPTENDGISAAGSGYQSQGRNCHTMIEADLSDGDQEINNGISAVSPVFYLRRFHNDTPFNGSDVLWNRILVVTSFDFSVSRYDTSGALVTDDDV